MQSPIREGIASTGERHLAMTWFKLSFQHSVFDPIQGESFPEFFPHRRFVIGPIADIHRGNRIALEHNQIGADVVEGGEGIGFKYNQGK